MCALDLILHTPKKEHVRCEYFTARVLLFFLPYPPKGIYFT